MSSFWSRNISLSIFGESHGPAIGIVIDNLPPGEYIDVEKLRQFMARRAPKKDGTTTPRGEKDLPQIMSGLLNDRTTGVPLCAFIQNTDTRSKDYSNLHAAPSGIRRLYRRNALSWVQRCPWRRPFFRQTHRTAVLCRRSLRSDSGAPGYLYRCAHRQRPRHQR